MGNSDLSSGSKMDKSEFNALFYNRDTSPYIVYAVNSPTYPEILFGCRDIISRQKKPYIFSGSTIVISGGHYELDIETGQLLTAPRKGLVEELGETGQRLGERVVASLIDPEDRVLVCYDRRWSTCRNWTEKARDIGFEVITTRDAAICLGNGELLPELKWLQGSIAGCGINIIASNQPPSSLEIELIEGACDGADLHELAEDFSTRIYQDPEAILNELNGYKVFASLGGPDKDSLAINRPETDVSSIENLIKSTAADLDVTLYDAGDLAIPDDAGYDRGVFAGWSSWSPIPGNWRKVV